MRKRWVGVLALFLVVAIAGCSGSGAGSSGSGADSKAGAGGGSGTSGASTAPIKVGEIGAETGPLAAVSKSLINGTALAIDQFNATGGYNGRKIEIDFCNDEGNPEKGLACARKLVDQDKVDLLLGPHFATVYAAAAPAFDHKIFGVTSNPHTTLDPKSMIFQSTAPTFQPAETAFTFFKNHGWMKVGFLAGQDESGATALKNVQPIAQKLGITLLVERFDPKDVSAQAQLTRLRSANPDVVMVWDTGAQVATVVKSYAQLGFDAPFAMNYGNMSDTFMGLIKGSEPKRLLVAAAKSVDPASITDPVHRQLVDKYAADYKAKFNAKADFLSAQGYDVATVLLTALKGAGPDGAKMKAFLEQGQPIRGVTWYNKYSSTSHAGPTGADAMAMVEWKGDHWEVAK